MTGYEYQSVNHDASIRAEHPDGDKDQVEVTITIGEHAEARITMWAEEFEHMAREVCPPASPPEFYEYALFKRSSGNRVTSPVRVREAADPRLHGLRPGRYVLRKRPVYAGPWGDA